MSAVLDGLVGQRALVTVRGFRDSMVGTIVAATAAVVVFDEDGADDRLVVPWKSIVAVSLRGVR
ncbi:hypothetical protein [Agrococcus sp. ProA11]|uniref:hypothetical protein n=1 Tax=Agrococcus chionoecetis TaxID=3153752 RepID=UPI0032617038